MIAPDGTVVAGSDRIVSATVLSPGVYRVTFDTDVSNCIPMIDTYQHYVYGSAYGFAGRSMYADTWALDPTTHAVLPHAYHLHQRQLLARSTQRSTLSVASRRR